MPEFRHFSEEDHRRIQVAIAAAEKSTSGELRIFIARTCSKNVLDDAASAFEKLEMHKTELRNGVLIYLALESRQFAVIGDAGIHLHVGDAFWHSVRTEMQCHFIIGDFIKGLECAIERIGKELNKHFPFQDDDKNELPDEIVYGFDDTSCD
jgi:uncharacterized membrane protein